MFKNKITKKLFIILSVSLILFTAMLVFIQLFIVSRMYSTTEFTVKHENDLAADVKKISEEYSLMRLNGADKKAVISILNDYTEKNSAYFLILDNDCNIKYSSTYKKAYNDIYLRNIEKEFKDQSAVNVNQRFRVNGFLGLPSKYVAVYAYTDSDECVVAITAEVHTSSDEAILTRYVLYVFAFGIGVAILLAALFSILITRPVIKMRNAATQMASFDFQQECNVSSNDEIGDLAASLNFLSSKLDKTLKELYKANKKLSDDLDLQKEIDLMRKEFIAAVSHEFKTPLTLIRGYTEGMQDNIIKEDAVDNAHAIIINQVDKMDRLVQELLELSKLESAGYQLNRHPFLIDDMLHDVADKYSIVMQEKQLHFTCSLSCPNILINADAFRIEQVVTNFLNNAMVNTPKDGSIILKSEYADNSVRISIYNDGNPIPTDELNKIWDKFYRCDKSRSGNTGGTGLGLSICKAILEKHGVKYGVRNLKNGVEFFFCLKTEN